MYVMGKAISYVMGKAISYVMGKAISYVMGKAISYRLYILYHTYCKFCLAKIKYIMAEEKFKDTKGVTICYNSKNRQNNGQKGKKVQKDKQLSS
jgi:hypothetical protein